MNTVNNISIVGIAEAGYAYEGTSSIGRSMC